MTELSEYAEKYENVRMTRESNGVLEVVLHTDGGILKWGEAIHRELWRAFADIAEDPENRVMILTGTGDTFCTEFTIDFSGDDNPRRWSEVQNAGKHLIEAILNVEIPMIGALNGLCHVHPELFALCDVLLAAEHATLHDFHMGRLENPVAVVPGDGGHIIWPFVLGPNRGRYFLLTGQELSAHQAKEYGVVSEVLPGDELLPRARSIANQLAEKPALTLRYTRVLFTSPFKRLVADRMMEGLALEGHGVIDLLTSARRQ